MKILDSLTLIIRSSNERTEALCKKMIIEQGIDQKRVVIVRETPFSATLKKSFQIALQLNNKWTYCIDADVLLRPGSIERMLSTAEKQNENVCGIQGVVMDKFFGGPRDAGNHLYRTRLLNKILKLIPEEGTDIRPETYALNKMKINGFSWLKIPYIIGIHDSEQYYKDIYRKCYVQGVKHINKIPLFLSHWRTKADEDYDYHVALQALSHSIANTEDLYIDSSQKLYDDGFKKLNIKEKADLGAEEYDLEKVEIIINNWSSPDIYFKYFPTCSGLAKLKLNKIEKVQHLITTRGLTALLKIFKNKFKSN